MNQKGERTREHILQQAAVLFRCHGFAATSISDLARATGVTKGSLYFHFPGKEAIALAVLERAERQFIDFLEASLVGPTPGARLEHFLDRALAIHRREGFVGGCLFGNTALEASDSDPLYAARVTEVFGRWLELLQRVIEEAQASGEIREDLPAAHLAQSLVATIEGGIMLSRLRKEEAPLRQCIDALRLLLAPQQTKED